MKDSQIQQKIEEITKKSKASFFLTLALLLFAVFSIYYYTTKISYLSGEVEKKNAELTNAEKKIHSTLDALNLAQEGTRFLINRQYADAIDKFNKFLVVYPSSPEALNFLGYSELRYAQFWKENSKRKNISKIQIDEYQTNAATFSQKAEAHLEKAASISNHSWSRYNLAILYFKSERKLLAIEQLDNLLKAMPYMVKWVCNDGQFREMRLDSTTADRFVEVVTTATKHENLESCWAIKPPKKH